MAGEERDNKFILACAKHEMFIRHHGRHILLVPGNFDLELGEVWLKSRDNESWSWSMVSVVESMGMTKSPRKMLRIKTEND